MVDHPRARKVADRIKVIVAEYLEFRIKDDRLGFVTITDCRVTGDLQHATLFYTVFGSDEERQASADVLEANKGRIRSAVGKGIGIRLTPSLEFIADALPGATRPTSRTCSRRPGPATPSSPARRPAPRMPVTPTPTRSRPTRPMPTTRPSSPRPRPRAPVAVDEDVQAR